MQCGVIIVVCLYGDSHVYRYRQVALGRSKILYHVSIVLKNVCTRLARLIYDFAFVDDHRARTAEAATFEERKVQLTVVRRLVREGAYGAAELAIDARSHLSHNTAFLCIALAARIRLSEVMPGSMLPGKKFCAWEDEERASSVPIEPYEEPGNGARAHRNVPPRGRA